MKSNEQIIVLINQRNFDSVRYAAIDRLKLDRLDVQAWVFLGEAMLGLNRVKMAKLCFERGLLLQPFSHELEQISNSVGGEEENKEDKKVLQLLAVDRTTVTACILTCNSSKTIFNCINALLNAVDEIVVVDTGSTDNTIEIVKSFGIPTYHFDWCDDFSAVRNYATSLATSEWILTVDSDEILYKDDKDSIRCLGGIFNDYKGYLVLNTLQINRAKGFPTQIDSIARMFKRHSDITWQRRIHEYPAPPQNVSLTQTFAPTVRIRLEHEGYDPTKVNIETKYMRNITILLRDLEDFPQDPRTLYFIGREYALLGRYELSITYLQDAIQEASNQNHMIINQIIALSQHVKEKLNI